MVKTKNRFVNIIYWLAIIGTDLFVYIVLGLLLMGYDDNYDSSKGEYWSLASMNSTEKIIYLAFMTWNVINIIGLIYIGHRFYKRTKCGT